LGICLFVYLGICLFGDLFICLFGDLFICLFEGVNRWFVYSAIRYQQNLPGQLRDGDRAEYPAAAQRHHLSV
jgi:hypothetical protein